MSFVCRFFGALAVCACLASAAAAQELRIYHLDVEQGDATLVVSPDGHALLFDAGPNGSGTNRVLPRLAELGVGSLDYTVASHYDADHIGGLDEVMNGGFRPLVAALDRGSNTTKQTQTYFDYVEAAGVLRRTIEPGEVLFLGAEVTIECVAVNGVTSDGRSAGLSADDENDSSVALVLRYRDFDYFVAGDLTGGGLGSHDVESLVAPLVRDVDVLRTCHHGSPTSTNQALVDRTRPDVAVITCGTSNAYGHPAQAVLDRLTASASCAAIWCTNPGSAATSPKLIVVGAGSGDDGDIALATGGLSDFRVNDTIYPIVVDATAPAIIEGPGVDSITASGARVMWATDEPAESRVEYGLTAAYGSTAASTALVTSHAITLSGLAPETTYHFRVGSVDASGNGPAWSGDFTLTTLAGSASIRVNEVCSYGGGADEWVELFNPGPAAVDMSGWTLRDNDTHVFVFPAGFTLPAGAYVVVTSANSGADDPDASDGLATFQGALPGRFGTTLVWNQAGDDVQLLDALGATADWMAYGSGTGIDLPPAGAWTSGTTYPAAPATITQSVKRYPNGTDTDAAADWTAPGATSRGVSNGGEPPPPPVPPTADAGLAAIGGEGAAVTFNGSASAAAGGATIVTYAWDFGDGATGAGVQPTHVYAEDGSYQVTLTVTDSNGLTATDGTSAEIYNVAPSVSAGGPYSGDAGAAIALAGSATDPSPADAAALTYAWTFGDGQGASGASVSHVYAAGGVYTATLTVTDPDGGMASASAQVTVTQPSVPPTARAGPDAAAPEGTAVGFDGGGSTPGDAPISSYAWNFGDGASASGQTAAHAYADDGTYVVTLTVTDTSGRSATDTLTVTVSNVAPVASAGGPYGGEATAPIAFSGDATDAGAADLATLAFSWDFGDGSAPASGRTPAHAYAAAGTYTATLTVSDGDGGVGVSSATVNVAAARPPAAVAGPDAEALEGAPVAFDGGGSVAGTAPISSYAWDFGDGATTSSAAAAHAYADDGTYVATLTVTDANGLSSSDARVVYVANAAPAASAGGPYSGTAGQPIAFAGAATDVPADEPTLSFVWDFGDGSAPASGATASHAYAAAGSYTVTLIVTDKDGGSMAATAAVTVALPPPTTANLAVISARNNATGAEYAAGSSQVQELENAGDGGVVRVNPGSAAWWEARFSAPGAVSSVVSARATVVYRMVSNKWSGTLTLQLRTRSGALLASRTLSKATSLTTVAWDVSAYVTPANAGELALRLVNVDSRGTKVAWAQADLEVTHR